MNPETAPIDDVAHRLAEAGRVEVAWFLRGVRDAIDGREYALGAAEAGQYRGEYRAGYRAAQSV